MTPRLFEIYVKGFHSRKKLELEEQKTKMEIERKTAIYQAYLTSRWVWAKKVNIERYLNTKGEKKTMTDDEMLRQAKALNKLFGGEVKSVG